MTVIAVGIGGALGAVLRFLIGEAFLTSSIFPYSTLLINWFGSFLFAFLIGKKLFNQNPLIKLGATTGFLGGFTTFSTFSIDAFTLLDQQELSLAMLYMLLSGFGCALLSFTGLMLGRKGGSST